MRVHKIVVHHSATARDATSTEAIRRAHIVRGYQDIGYHAVILGSGRIERGRSVSVMGAHAKGANQNSLGVCLTGNFEVERPTSCQIKSLVRLLTDWCAIYGVEANRIYGHGQVPGGTTKTQCPGSNLQACLCLVRGQVASNLRDPVCR